MGYPNQVSLDIDDKVVKYFEQSFTNVIYLGTIFI